MAKVSEIVITVEGGRISDVQIPKGAHIRVKIMDFDVQEDEHPRIKFDRDGSPYEETVWES